MAPGIFFRQFPDRIQEPVLSAEKEGGAARMQLPGLLS